MSQFCLFCNSPIESIPKRKPKKFCSPKCKFKAWKQNHKERYKELVTEKNILYKKHNIERWKLEGLCNRCGRVRADSKKWCQKCLDWQNNYYLLHHNKKIQEAKNLSGGNVTT
jgi:hypothetical protein